MKKYLIEGSIVFIMLFHLLAILMIGASASEFIYIDF